MLYAHGVFDRAVTHTTNEQPSPFTLYWVEWEWVNLSGKDKIQRGMFYAFGIRASLDEITIIIITG